MRKKIRMQIILIDDSMFCGLQERKKKSFAERIFFAHLSEKDKNNRM